MDRPTGSLTAPVRSLPDAVHDINSPLGTALASCQLALRLLPDGAPPQLKVCLERAVVGIQQSAAVARGLVVTPTGTERL